MKLKRSRHSTTMLFKKNRPKLLWGLAIGLAGLFFLFDLMVPLGVAMGIPHLFLILVSWWMPRKRDTLLLAGLCSGLIIIGYFNSPPVEGFWAAITNRVFALVAIWAAGFFIIFSRSWFLDLKKELAFSAESSERNYRNLVEGSISGILIHREHIVLFSNQAFAEMLGYDSPENLVGVNIREKHIPLKNQETHLENYQARLSGQSIPVVTELEIRKKDGEPAILEGMETVVQWEGEPALLVTRHNITERKIADSKALATQKLLETVLETIPHRIHVKDKEGRFILVNQALSEELELDVEEILGKRTREIPTLHPDYKKSVLEQDRQVFETGEKFYDPEFQTLSAKGEEKYFQVVKLPLKNEAGEVVGIVGAGVDITEQKLAEKENKAHQRLLEMVLETIPQRIYMKNLDGRYLFANSAIAKDYNLTVEEFLGKRLLDLPFMTPGNREAFHQQDLQVIETGQELKVPDFQFASPDGQKLILHVEKVPFKNEAGEIVGIIGMGMDVTEQVTSREILSQFKTTLDLALDCIFIFDPTSLRFTYMNQGALDQVGYTREEMLLMTPVDLKPEYDETRFRETITPLISGGEKRAFFRTNHQHKDGHLIPVEILVQYIAPQNEVPRFVAIVRDITEQQQTEKQLISSKNLLQTVFDALPHNLFVKDHEGRYIMANKKYASMFGKIPGEMIGKKIESLHFYSKETEKSFNDQHFQVIESGEAIIDPEFQIMLNDSDSMYRHLIRVPIKNPDGSVASVVSITIDITEMIKTRESLLENQKLLETIFDSIPQSLWVKNSFGRYLMANKTHASEFGLEPKDLVGFSLDEFSYLAPPSLTAIRELENEVLASGEKREYPSLKVTTQAGMEYYSHMVAAPLKGTENQTIGTVSIAKDITSRIEEEAEKLLLSSALEQTAEGVMVTNTLGEIQFINSAFEKITGYLREEIIGETPQILKSGKQNRAYYENLWGTILQGRVFNGVLTNRKKDGSLYEEELHISPVRNRDGNTTHFIAVKRDITLQVQAEEQLKVQQKQLIQADKMASLGVLVSGVAHEINNPNTAIMLNAPVIEKIWDDLMPIMDKIHKNDDSLKLGNFPYLMARDEVQGMLKDISTSSERVKLIVENLKNFARKQEDVSFASTDINQVVKSAVHLLKGQIGHSTRRFAVEYAPNIPAFFGNFQEIEQVLINLLSNACQALPSLDHGVFITTDFDPEKNQVLVQVADEGMGISEENLGKIMDPFFTTKRETGGTGLGLSVSFGIVSDHSGKLSFESNQGKGTKALLALPIKQNKNKLEAS